MRDECTITRDGAVAILTLNRPEQLNAFNGALYAAMLEAIDEVDNDPSVRAIVFTGAGRIYCAGADFREGFDAPAFKHLEIVEDGEARDSGGVLNLRLFALDKPVIAAVNGSAVGIGATMLLPMDIRVGSNTAKFSFPFSRRGIVFDGAASWFLPRLVGYSKAYEWVLRGHLFGAEEALAAGFMNQLTAPENVLSTALEIAHDIAQNCSPTSLAQNKQLMRQSMLGDGKTYGPHQAHISESRMLNEAFTSHDCEEGVKAFMEKRAPRFEDYKP